MLKLTEFTADQQDAVQATRERVAALHAELPRWELVVWTAGNVSERVPGMELFVIKPSGVSYDELDADTMVVCTLDGLKIDDGTPDRLSPSSDTAATPMSIATCLRSVGWCTRIPPTQQPGRRVANPSLAC